VRCGEWARGFQERFTHRQRHLGIIGHERRVSLECGGTSWRELLQNLLKAQEFGTGAKRIAKRQAK
jgi:hypothetical protein